ncbi:MAG: hypothetical protein WBM98_01375 [Maribacter sp.]|uniref:hypothetical protein n=1 Tax=Maribacter sp. TaxID=1897614 RepID=UPI003C761667
MKTSFSILLLILLFSGRPTSELKEVPNKLPMSDFLDKAPEFYVLQWNVGTKLTSQKTEFFIEVDSVGKQGIDVLLNQRKEPVLYTAAISTPVCADGECKLMNLKLYWTLLGEYAGFDRYPDLPLTKYDHDIFLEEDYQKLHELLTDDKSILGRRSIDRLVEQPKMRTVNGVDAVSGATITQVKESIVPGALYSCYTAWHLAHGDIREKLKARTLAVLNENIIIDMLYSNNPEYQLFALEKMDQELYLQHHVQISEIFKTAIPLVRSVVAKSFMTHFKATPNLQLPFWQAFDKIDVGSRSLLLKNLDTAPPFVVDILSGKLSAMSKNQLNSFFSHLSPKHELSREILNNIETFANSDSETYAYLAKQYIEEGQ